jgi:hypothetical protein
MRKVMQPDVVSESCDGTRSDSELAVMTSRALSATRACMHKLEIQRGERQAARASRASAR